MSKIVDTLSVVKTFKFWKELVIMTLGMFVTAAAVYYFLVPSKLIIGTISGLSIASSEDGSNAVSEQLISFLARQGKKMGAELIYTYSENDIAGFTKLDDTYSVQWQF